MHLLRNPAQAGLKPSLPCVKGGGTACRDGGIVKSDNVHKNNPSVSFADSSLYTREPLTQDHSTLNFYLLSAHRQSLYGTPPLWRGFRLTKKAAFSINHDEKRLFAFWRYGKSPVLLIFSAWRMNRKPLLNTALAVVTRHLRWGL